MNILGISGLENTMPFKRAHWPQLEEREYRISQGHDSAAALLVGGVPVAASAEERFSREKHTGAFPAKAIQSCLTQSGIRITDVDAIAHSFDYAPYRTAYSVDAVTARLFNEVCSKQVLLNLVQRDFPGFPAERVHSVPHHLAHAASAYFTSGWDDCLVIVADAMG